MMKKIVSLCLTLALVLGIMSVPAIAEGDSVNLVVACFYGMDSASGWDGLVAAFNEEYPNVTIEPQITTNGDDYMTKLVSQLAAGDAPDVIAMENKWVTKFVDAGLLMPINDYIANDPDVKIEDFYPHLIEHYTVDGNLYGLPYDAQPTAMFFYNKGLFDEAGLEYPNEEWTWDDMKNAAIALTKTDETGRTTQWGLLANSWRNYIYTNGGRILSEDETTCVMDSPRPSVAYSSWLTLFRNTRSCLIPQH